MFIVVEEPVDSLPTIGAVTVSVANVPTDVNEDAVTLEASVFPVNVFAAATLKRESSPAATVPVVVPTFRVAEFPKSAVFAFKFKADCVAVETGLFASLVLSTFPKPTLCFLLHCEGCLYLLYERLNQFVQLKHPI